MYCVCHSGLTFIPVMDLKKTILVVYIGKIVCAKEYYPVYEFSFDDAKIFFWIRVAPEILAWKEKILTEREMDGEGF